MSTFEDGDHAKRILEDSFFQRILDELREDVRIRSCKVNPENHNSERSCISNIRHTIESSKS